MNSGYKYAAYGLEFVILVAMTVFFTFTYLKRVLYMAFLTLMAPLVALTYPIDKITDGSAQGFDKWLKEYIFNLLLQPLHLLLYFILITSAFHWAGTNFLYSLVAIGFMIPAEKLLRGFFGFEKAHTPPVLGGAAGAALAMTGIQKLGNLGRSNGSGSSKKGEAGDSSDNNTKINYAQKDLDYDNLFLGKDREKVDKSNELPEAKTESESDIEAIKEGEYYTQRLREQKALEDRQQQIGEQKNPNYLRQLANGSSNNEELNGQQATGIENGRNEQKQGDTSTNVRPIRMNGRNPELSQNKARKKPGKVGKTLRGMKAVGMVGLRKVPKLAKTAGRYTLKAAGATALGAMGAAIGVASGDIGNVAKYTTLGAVAGSSLGDGAINAGRATINTARTARDTFEVGYYGDDVEAYEEIDRQRQIKRFIKENKTKLKDNNFTNEQITKMTESGGTIEQFLDYGVRDIDSIIAAQKMINDDRVTNINSVTEAAFMARYAERMGSDYKATGKRRKQWENTISEDLISHGDDEHTANRKTANTMKYIKEFNQMKNRIV